MARTQPPRLWARAAQLRLLVEIVGALLLYYLLPIDRNGAHPGARPVQTILAVVLFVVLVGLSGRQVRMLVLGGGHPIRIQLLILLIVLVILLFSLVYLGMADQFDGLDTKTDSLYFTISTLATVGFGDVHAVDQPARVVVTVQMVFDLVYLAALASVVSGVIRKRVAAVRRESDPPDAAAPGSGPAA